MLKLKLYPERSPFWCIRGTVKGQRVFESTGTADRRQAEAYRIRREREIWNERALGQQRPVTFAEAVEAYLDAGGSPRFLMRLLDHFKEMPLPSIGQAEIDKAARALYPGRKPSTLMRQVYGPMIAVLRHAAGAELPGATPRQIRCPKVDKVMARWGSDAQIASIMAECSPRIRAAVLVLTYTGLRVSELLSLQRSDLTLRPGWAQVSTTKNGEPAFVPLPPQAHEAIAEIMQEGETERVFAFSRQALNRGLQRAAERAGVPYLSTHQIGRHSFAARLLSHGYDLKTVKEAGRWKKLAVVDEAYGHLEMRQAHDAMLDVAESGAKAVQTHPQKKVRKN